MMMFINSNLECLRTCFISGYVLVASVMIIWTIGQDLPSQINTAAVLSTGPPPPPQILFLAMGCLHSNKLQALTIDPVEEQLTNTLSVQN
jgi:hypothetical protein